MARTLKSMEKLYNTKVRTENNIRRIRKKIKSLVSGHRDVDPEDLVQTVFLKAWSALGKFRGDSSYQTWLFRIAVNVAFDELRKVRQNSVLVSLESGNREGGPSLQELVVDTDPTSDPYRFTYSGEIQKTVKTSLSSMPLIQAEVLKMRQMGLHHKEVAVALNTTEETSKNYQFRGRKRLRQDLIIAGVVTR